MANQIAYKPELTWWLPYTLKKRNIIISKIRKKYLRTNHKYEVRLPKDITEEIHID